MRPGVGYTLPPNAADLDLLAPVYLTEPDYYEVAPETLWAPSADASPVPNRFHRRFQALRAETGKPFVAHGVAYSVGSESPAEDERRREWRAHIAHTHERFDFQWYTDHLGTTVLDWRMMALPLPLPMSTATAQRVRGRMRALQQVVPHVGLENSVFYHRYGDPLDEPAFLAECVGGPDMHVLLDLHNLFTMGVNYDVDPLEYLNRLPLERVIEIHVSGGRDSEPAWLPGGQTMRLDSHDDAVPDAVWSLLDTALPRCTNLRGVTLERMEGTVGAPDVGLLTEELKRVRRAIDGR